MSASSSPTAARYPTKKERSCSGRPPPHTGPEASQGKLARMDSWLDHSGRFFNPSPRVSTVAIAPGESCIVVDEALANPEGLIDWATNQRFVAPDFAYPGLLVDAPPSVSTMVGDYFAQHVRSRLGGR